jgi:hypothetical protein
LPPDGGAFDFGFHFFDKRADFGQCLAVAQRRQIFLFWLRDDGVFCCLQVADGSDERADVVFGRLYAIFRCVEPGLKIGSFSAQRRETRAHVEPAEQIWVSFQRGSLAREIDENFLRDVLCPMFIAGKLAQCGRIDEINSPLHQFGEGALARLVSEFPQELGISHRLDSDSRRIGKPPKNPGSCAL